MCMWIEEFAKTCGMGVGDEGGVYIYVCGQKSSLRPVGWVQGMKEVYIYVYVDEGRSSLRPVGWVQGMKEVYIYIWIEEFAKTV